MVKKYMKKPVAVEALRTPVVDLNAPSKHEDVLGAVSVLQWLDEGGYPLVDDPLSGVGGKYVWISGDGLVIHTLEGDMLVGNGDWIIKGVEGEFYPCKPDIFEKTYVEVAGSLGLGVIGGD